MEKNKIAVLGLGYVGLPLAVEFSKHFETVGFDINSEKVDVIQSGNDPTKEIGDHALNQALKNGFVASSVTEEIKNCNIYIVTVPTDIHPDKTSNLEPLQSASETIGLMLKQGDLVIYESTTYPGCTEEFCIPILEKTSGLKLNTDFGVGYSPERINPGDKQRNINISFMNELAMIFDKMEINTKDVLAAAGTKWDFLPFKPGLVGGHCIGLPDLTSAITSSAEAGKATPCGIS